MKYISILVLFLVFLSCQQNKKKSVATTKTEYMCLPCGLTCDTIIFNNNGTCPHCQMDLIKKSVLDEYNESIENVEFDSNLTKQKEPSSFQKFYLLNGKEVEPLEFNKFMENIIGSLEIPALSIAIMNRNETVFYQNYGVKNIEDKDSVNSATLFEAASMSKPFFAFAVLELAQEGIIDLDKPLYEYYPHPDLLYDKRHKEITARMVLSHTTGLPNWRSGSLKFEADPNTKHIYSGEGIEYLGKVIEKVTNEDLDVFLTKSLIKKYDMKYSSFVESENTKYNMAIGHKEGEISGRNISFKAHPAYGLRTNAQDFANFINGITKSWLFKKMIEPQYEISEEKFVGLGIFQRESSFGKKYYHTGNNSNRFTGRFEIYPDKNFGFVFFTNCEKEEILTEKILEYLTRDL